MTLSPEILVPRLGEVLIKEGLINEDQLKHALEEQKRISTTGRWARIGEILVDLGYINHESLNQAITRQILRFQYALIQSNKNLESNVATRTAELEAANRKLSELDVLKTNFVSNISHELRTPLTHIKGYIDLIMTEGCVKENPQVVANLEVVQRSTERLENLINNLIMFSTAETGQLALTLESFNILETVELSISHFAHMAANKAITIKKEFTHDIIRVQADKNKIAWVINQLIDNSLKYTNANGVIVVRINTVKDQAIIEIQDNGPGISQSQLEDVFIPFHQLDGSANRIHGGIGIGLTLAKLIIEAHNSEILLESSPENGSLFKFKLLLSQ
jgi:signal transduction histidine kinase